MLSLDEKNKCHVMFSQALLGAITPNFRMIAIDFQLEAWKILFVLEKEDAFDLEEIEDILCQFDALCLGNVENVPFQPKTIITTEFIACEQSDTVRIIYKRKEP